MKLLHLMPALKPGGPVQALKALMGHLSSTDHVVLSLEAQVRGSDLIAFMQAGAKVLRAPSQDTLYQSVSEADVVLVHAYNHPSLIRALAGPLPLAKWITWYKVSGRSLPQAVFPDRLDSGVSCVFTALSETARKGGWPVIPSMVQPEFIGLKRQAHSGIVVDYIGSTNIAKLHRGAIRFLDAVRHSDMRVRLHGGHLDPEMDADLKRASQPERFEIGGYATNVPALLASSDIFITPMAPESYASSDLALQEAMHAGLVPVVLGNAGPADMVTNGIDGRVTEDGVAFTAAIQELCDDYDARHRLGQAARATARDRFDPNKNAARLEAIIKARFEEPASGYGYVADHELTPAALYLISQGWEEEAAKSALLDGDRKALRDFAASLGTVAAKVEGGLIQWRNACPDDRNLRWLSAIWHEAVGADDIAKAEFAGLH